MVWMVGHRREDADKLYCVGCLSLLVITGQCKWKIEVKPCFFYAGSYIYFCYICTNGSINSIIH